MKSKADGWPRKTTAWIVNGRLMMSIPFTWELPKAREMARGYCGDVFVGGPAVDLMPDFFHGLTNVTVGRCLPGILQRVNPQATRSTTGCVRRCQFCAIGTGKIEAGGMVELPDWPDLPVYCDNNILAASVAHFDRVMDRVEKHGWFDFNQGVDARLLTPYHAERMKRVKGGIVRLALDHDGEMPLWDRAYEVLRTAKVAKSRIRSYVLVGFTDGPEAAWARCKWVEAHGVKPLPMWFHALDAMEKNKVSPKQAALGWDDYQRRRLFQWFYQHKEAKPPSRGGEGCK